MKYFLILFLFAVFVAGTNTAFAQSDNYTVGKVQFPDRCYSSVGTGTVIIIDPDMNQNSNQEESVPIQLWSSRDTDVRIPNAIETGSDTGIFEATVFFNMYGEAFSQRIRVLEGDTLHAKYIDTTVPIESQQEIEAFVVMGTLPPNQKLGKYWESLSMQHDGKYVYDTCMAEFIAEIKPTDYALNALDIFYPTPVKQLKSGLFPFEIKCKEHLELIFKYYDSSPICVSSETAMKLTARLGWIHDLNAFVYPKSELDESENKDKIIAGFEYLGSARLTIQEQEAYCEERNAFRTGTNACQYNINPNDCSNNGFDYKRGNCNPDYD